MAPSQSQTPSEEERASFYWRETRWLVGYRDAIDIGLGNGEWGEPVDGVEGFVENLEMSFRRGVQEAMQNRRETGHSPMNAWRTTVNDDWPYWARHSIAMSEHYIFDDYESVMSDEEINYVSFLEANYDLP